VGGAREGYSKSPQREQLTVSPGFGEGKATSDKNTMECWLGKIFKRSGEGTPCLPCTDSALVKSTVSQSMKENPQRGVTRENRWAPASRRQRDENVRKFQRTPGSRRTLGAKICQKSGKKKTPGRQTRNQSRGHKGNRGKYAEKENGKDFLSKKRLGSYLRPRLN